MIDIYSWSWVSVPLLARFTISWRQGVQQSQGRQGEEASGPCVSTLAFAEMCFVLSRPQVYNHTRSCGVPCSQWHIFLRSPFLSSFCIPSGHMRAGGGPLCLPSGSVPGSLLPLGPFWTHIKLFCNSQPHAGVRGNSVGCLRSSCPVLLIAFLFLKEMIRSCCFPGST